MKNPTKDLWSNDLKVLYLANFKSIKDCKAQLNPNWFSLFLVVSGAIHFMQDSSVISLSTGKMCVVTTEVEVIAMTSPLRICMLSFSMDFAFSKRIARFGKANLESLFFRSPFVLLLNGAELKYILLLFEMLKKKLIGDPTFFQSEIITLHVSLLFYGYGELCYKYGKNRTQVYSRSEKIVMEFVMLVELHSRAHHDVKFYADSLFVTDGHLRKSVRVVLGLTAKHLIEMSIISESYSLLSNANLSITEVSEHLNFSSSQSFSGFFKKHTKLSPSQYRDSLIY